MFVRIFDHSYIIFIVFLQQKTAYEVLISDWSSVVCSSDLTAIREPIRQQGRFHCRWRHTACRSKWFDRGQRFSQVRSRSHSSFAWRAASPPFPPPIAPHRPPSPPLPPPPFAHPTTSPPPAHPPAAQHALPPPPPPPPPP